MAAATVDITECDILNILKGEKFKSFEIAPLSDNKVLGLWGDYLILKVITDSRSYEFFLKAVPRHNEKRLKFMNQTGFFERESEIYGNFIPKLAPLSSFSWSVKCFMVKNGHFIVLEYLKDYKMVEKVSMLLDHEHYEVSNLRFN